MKFRYSFLRAKPDPPSEVAVRRNRPSSGFIAMPLFLWHTVGFALFYALMRFVWIVPETPSLLWWVTRPLWFIGPALATVPLLAATRRIRPRA